MNVITFTSATGNNLSTAEQVMRETTGRGVALNFSDAPDCGAVARARSLGIPSLICDARYIQQVGTGRITAQQEYHDDVRDYLHRWESWNGKIDLIVLAYHRIIRGSLLSEYAGRMINQHPGDLRRKLGDGTRQLVGMSAVKLAHDQGIDHTRTSTFLVNSGIDQGPLLAVGPAVSFATRPRELLEPEYLKQHENRQKKESDKPALEWVLRSFLSGELSFHGYDVDNYQPYLNGAPMHDPHVIEEASSK
ncbi:formyltransferase family protein [Rhodococcus sp. P1Y]|uniref:formyltransferase family protein n=1 Tax=Rhodococcus sp. P1Y TaxID=1302308 RepID=UPI001379ADF6|nr:formyltransferase family protein [Rhodococcus sp. P1Y]